MARNTKLPGGVMKFSRSAAFSKRAQHKKGKVVTKTEKKKIAAVSTKTVGGDKNGSTRKVAVNRHPKFYPTLTVRKTLKSGHGKKPFSAHRRTLRASITPGTVLILLTGVHRGKKVVFLKQLDSGLLLVTGPYKVNGVPLRRAQAKGCIATGTKIDVSAVKVPANVNDVYFKRTKQVKKAEEGIFEQKEEKFTASEQRKADQKSVDASILAQVSKTDFMKGYLRSEFGLSKGQLPHKIKF